MNLPQILKNTLENSSILTDIICLLFYGSAKNKEDFHEHSDYDFHIVIKEYNLGNLTILKSILSKFKYLDISIQSLAEIQNQEKQIIFQNGRQGIYFINMFSEILECPNGGFSLEPHKEGNDGYGCIDITYYYKFHGFRDCYAFNPSLVDREKGDSDINI